MIKASYKKRDRESMINLAIGAGGAEGKTIVGIIFLDFEYDSVIGFCVLDVRVVRSYLCYYAAFHQFDML